MDGNNDRLYSSTVMGTQFPPMRSCPVCRVAMQSVPDDPSLGYVIFVCDNCNTKVLVHEPTPDNDDED